MRAQRQGRRGRATVAPPASQATLPAPPARRRFPPPAAGARPGWPQQRAYGRDGWRAARACAHSSRAHSSQEDEPPRPGAAECAPAGRAPACRPRGPPQPAPAARVRRRGHPPPPPKAGPASRRAATELGPAPSWTGTVFARCGAGAPPRRVRPRAAPRPCKAASKPERMSPRRPLPHLRLPGGRGAAGGPRRRTGAGRYPRPQLGGAAVGAAEQMEHDPVIGGVGVAVVTVAPPVLPLAMDFHIAGEQGPVALGRQDGAAEVRSRATVPTAGEDHPQAIPRRGGDPARRPGRPAGLKRRFRLHPRRPLGRSGAPALSVQRRRPPPIPPGLPLALAARLHGAADLPSRRSGFVGETGPLRDPGEQPRRRAPGPVAPRLPFGNGLLASVQFIRESTLRQLEMPSQLSHLLGIPVVVAGPAAAPAVGPPAAVCHGASIHGNV